jgi:hypothetical protein
MRFGDDNSMALSRQHIAAHEKDAPGLRRPRFSFDAFICCYHHAAGMNRTKWQLTLTFAARTD